MNNKHTLSPLMHAVENHDLQQVTALLKDANTDVNSQNFFGHTPLNKAAWEGCTEIARLLLTRPDIDINRATQDGYTPLISSLSQPHKNKFTQYMAISRMLLEHPAINVNACTEYGNTALITVTDDTTLRLLLARADLDINYQMLGNPYTSGDTALMEALKDNQLSKALLLLTHPDINVNLHNNEGNTALILAVYHNQVSLVHALVSHQGINLNHRNNAGISAFVYATILENREILDTLSTAGASLDEHDTPSLISAAAGNLLIDAILHNDNERAYTLLQKSYINVNTPDTYGWTPFFWATQRNNSAIVDMLLAQTHININAQTSDGETALMKAYGELFDRLLALPTIDLTLRNHEGNTILMERVRYAQHPRYALALISHGDCALNAQNNDGNTALMIALLHENYPVIEALVAQPSINLSLKNNENITALMYATQQGDTPMIELLLKHGAHDIDGSAHQWLNALAMGVHNAPLSPALIKSILLTYARKGIYALFKALAERSDSDLLVTDHAGNTCLLLASSAGHMAIVQFLLSTHAQLLNIPNTHGTTPLMRAVQHNHTAIVELLLSTPGINIHAADTYGITALIIAKQTPDCAESMHLLLKAGA